MPLSIGFAKKWYMNARANDTEETITAEIRQWETVMVTKMQELGFHQPNMGFYVKTGFHFSDSDNSEHITVVVGSPSSPSNTHKTFHVYDFKEPKLFDSSVGSGSSSHQ